MSETKVKYRLFEISEQLEELEEAIALLETATITVDVEELYEEILNEVSQTKQEFSYKIDNILAFIKSCETFMKTRKQEAKRLTQLAKKDESTIKFLKEYLLKHLQKQNIKKLKTKRFNLTIARNGGKSPLNISPEIEPEDLPAKYRTVTYAINKDAIRSDLASGKSLDFASFGDRQQSLRIK